MLFKTIYSTLVLFLLGILAAADEFDTYGAVITNVTDALNSLDAAVISLVMSPSFDWSPVERAFQVVLDVTKSGTEALTSMPVVGDNDATNVVVTASTLPQIIDVLVADFGKVVSIVEEKQETQRALAFLDKFRAQSAVLVGLLVNKTPADSRSIVKDMLTSVAISVAEGIRVFNEPPKDVERRVLRRS
jgi:hypothetical protein